METSGELRNKRLGSTELALYLVLKYDWPVYIEFTVSEEQAAEIQRLEAPGQEEVFDAYYN